MQWLLVAMGGALGALSRIAIDRAVTGVIGPTVWGTFLINVTGSFALGVFVAMAMERTGWPDAARPFVAAGFLASFTTFSTLTVASVQMLHDGEVVRASLNVLGSIALGLMAAYLGILVGRAL